MSTKGKVLGKRITFVRRQDLPQVVDVFRPNIVEAAGGIKLTDLESPTVSLCWGMMRKD